MANAKKIDSDFTDIFLLLSVLFYCLCCPYTKVEESFNIQSIHDLLYFGLDIDSFDHLEFPGVVPRTFIGSLLISAIVSPFAFILNQFNVQPLYLQILSRTILGFLCWLAYLFFREGVNKKFGIRTGQLLAVLLSLQFHICFYMSRTLPNTFALMFCFLAYGFWLMGKPLHAISVLTAVTTVFRCDILILLAPFTLQLLISREVGLFNTIKVGILTGTSVLLLTVLIDSYFWQRWVWPEGVVLFFNTVQNKSSEWGVSPWHWYFSTAIPKALHFTLIWLIFGFIGISYPSSLENNCSKNQLSLTNIMKEVLFSGRVNKRIIYYSLPVLFFVFLYSILPHKELRFIFPALPLLTLASAAGLNDVLPSDSSELLFPLNLLFNKHRSKEKRHEIDNTKKTAEYNKLYRKFYNILLSLIVLGSFLGMFLLANCFLSASIHNYPGAHAIDRLITQHLPLELHHEIHNMAAYQLPDGTATRPIFVHIDAGAAMKGVTRFLQQRFMVYHNPDEKYKRKTSTRLHFNLTPQKYHEFQDKCKNKKFKKDHDCIDFKKEKELLFYSKDENTINFDEYDWLISENPRTGGAGFIKVEEINGFHKFKISKKGLEVEVKPKLYLLHNKDAQ